MVGLGVRVLLILLGVALVCHAHGCFWRPPVLDD